MVIDLNGNTVAMSKALYYQQRFFSCISLKSVAFPLNQGPGFFGMEPKYANNVVIKNGNIGLSSHHGIHGHYNKDVVIEDVHIYDFETHGVQMSYFENLKMKNVEIGPSSTVAYLSGEYGYARWTVASLERIRDGDGVLMHYLWTESVPNICAIFRTLCVPGMFPECSWNRMVVSLRSGQVVSD